MSSKGDMCMSFNFAEENLIIKGAHQNGFYSYLVGLSIWFIIF